MALGLSNITISSSASKASYLASLPVIKRREIFDEFTAADLIDLEFAWEFWARKEQLPPDGKWTKWLLLAGRSFGKTRAGAETVRRWAEEGRRLIALVAPTAADSRKVMVEGPAGILAVSPPWFRPVYHPGNRELIWPNGCQAITYSADEPERLRGPQHDAAWCDELAAWRYPEAWDMLMFGLRLGNHPRVLVTTTPKPIDLLIGPGERGRFLGLLRDPSCVVTRGSTYDNRANLPENYFLDIVRRYEGTRLGRQELNAEILDDMPGALWSRDIIENARLGFESPHSDLTRIVVAIDPAVTSGEDSDETGIIVAGKDAAGHGYILADGSGRYPPTEWARKAVALYHERHADRIVAEVNNGGDMVEATIRIIEPNASYSAVRASRGKVVRAEPVAALYEQGRIHHVGMFAALEDQMCAFTTDFDRGASGYSPDRVDALVWALTELLVEPIAGEGIFELYRAKAAKPIDAAAA